MKKQTNKKLLFPIVVFLGFILVSPISFIAADWGDSDEDCMDHHGITRHYARYIANPEITLDGIGNESVWNREDVYRYIVAAGSNNQSEYYFKTYIHVQWVFDDTDLYILAGWNDNSFDLPVNQRDLFMLCWNINCTNYSVGMYLESNSMLTTEPGARVDNWLWARNTKANNSGVYDLIDQCHDDQSWLEAETGIYRDPEAAMIYGNWDYFTYQYQLEIRRPLTTLSPDVDVQFSNFSNSTEGRYRFALATADITGGEAHAISWTHELDFSNSVDYAYLESLNPTNTSTNSSSTGTETDNSNTDENEDKTISSIPLMFLMGMSIISVIFIKKGGVSSKELI
ncbi:hypothetical protein NEF87_005005 [Candidatus Lokiarchaeum ossiferum]|uniref:Carbohydrate-binding domain-containing protein n=1 Tax=Candidatus Lokiarchaeum ossiferum TaxID=2951803 RepID=A0ABY6HYY2_9ARCH|nr:hypothetical protein NEF87_005005 [Candidatus Lokiarchaeum sp. B-35]